MAIVKYIPLRQSEAQRAMSQELTLDGVRVRFVSRLVALTDRWYLDVLGIDQSLILGGLAMVTGVDLWRPFKHLEIPPGELFVYNAKTREPGTFVTQDVDAILLYRPVG